MQRWCRATGRRPGAIISLEQAWRLAKLWYADRLTPSWEMRTAEETQARLDLVGLTGEAWRLNR